MFSPRKVQEWGAMHIALFALIALIALFAPFGVAVFGGAYENGAVRGVLSTILLADRQKPGICFGARRFELSSQMRLTSSQTVSHRLKPSHERLISSHRRLMGVSWASHAVSHRLKGHVRALRRDDFGGSGPEERECPEFFFDKCAFFGFGEAVPDEDGVQSYGNCGRGDKQEAEIIVKSGEEDGREQQNDAENERACVVEDAKRHARDAF